MKKKLLIIALVYLLAVLSLALVSSHSRIDCGMAINNNTKYYKINHSELIGKIRERINFTFPSFELCHYRYANTNGTYSLVKSCRNVTFSPRPVEPPINFTLPHPTYPNFTFPNYTFYRPRRPPFNFSLPRLLIPPVLNDTFSLAS